MILILDYALERLALITGEFLTPDMSAFHPSNLVAQLASTRSALWHILQRRLPCTYSHPSTLHLRVPVPAILVRALDP